MRNLILLFCLFALPGCGTGLKRQTSTSDVGTSAPVDLGPNGSPCARPARQGSSTAMQTDLSVIEICQGVSNSDVEIKLSSYPQLFGDYCLFPFSATQVYPETCLTINGDPTITLSTNQFSGVVIVHKADEAAFGAYVADPNANVAPAYGTILLR